MTAILRTKKQQILSAKKQQQVLAEDLMRDKDNPIHFNRYEIDVLMRIHGQQTQNGKLDRAKFRDILHSQFEMTDDLIMDRVFRVFDKDNDGNISMEEWIRGLSVFLRGTRQEHIRFCFDVYDFNADGFISREETFSLFKKAMFRQSSDEDIDEGIKDLVELVLKKLDVDGDHRISFADFSTSVAKESLLLQSFGQCLPDDAVINGYEVDNLQPPNQ